MVGEKGISAKELAILVARDPGLFPPMDCLLILTNEKQLSRHPSPSCPDRITNLIADICGDKLETTRILVTRNWFIPEFSCYRNERRHDADQPGNC